MEELRCESHQLFGRLVEGKLEVACKNRRCKGDRNVVVRHYFDPLTGELLYTKKYKEPSIIFRESAQTPQEIFGKEILTIKKG